MSWCSMMDISSMLIIIIMFFIFSGPKMLSLRSCLMCCFVLALVLQPVPAPFPPGAWSWWGWWSWWSYGSYILPYLSIYLTISHHISHHISPYILPYLTKHLTISHHISHHISDHISHHISPYISPYIWPYISPWPDLHISQATHVRSSTRWLSPGGARCPRSWGKYCFHPILQMYFSNCVNWISTYRIVLIGFLYITIFLSFYCRKYLHLKFTFSPLNENGPCRING